jgi:hypothetical protein
MDFSSIADPFGDQDSGGGSRGKRSSRQHDRDEHGKGQRLQHGDNARPGHREKEEEDDDGGQTFLFLKVSAGVQLGQVSLWQSPTTALQPCTTVLVIQHCNLLYKLGLHCECSLHPRSICRNSSTSLR